MTNRAATILIIVVSSLALICTTTISTLNASALAPRVPHYPEPDDFVYVILALAFGIGRPVIATLAVHRGMMTFEGIGMTLLTLFFILGDLFYGIAGLALLSGPHPMDDANRPLFLAFFGLLLAVEIIATFGFAVALAISPTLKRLFPLSPLRE